MSDEIHLNRNDKSDKTQYFMTKTSYLSIEINAHCLLFLIQLVKEKKLPNESLNTYLFNSQTCEAMFRSTRSLSGIHSTRINFSVADYLQRSKKLCALNQIKDGTSFQDKLLFPTHHKHRDDDIILSSENIDNVGSIDINQVIRHSYKTALDMIDTVDISNSLKKHGLLDLEFSSSVVYENLNRTKRIFDDSGTSFDDDLSESDDASSADDDIHSDDEDDIIGDEENNRLLVSAFEETDSDTEIISSNRAAYSGLRLVDEISSPLNRSYFKVKLNGQTKYLHKQSAVWLLTDQKNNLSSERLLRVIQAGREEK